MWSSYIFNQDRSSNRSPRQTSDNLARTTTTTRSGPMGVAPTTQTAFSATAHDHGYQQARPGGNNRQRHAHRHQMGSAMSSTHVFDGSTSDLHDHSNLGHSHRRSIEPSLETPTTPPPSTPSTEVPPEFVELPLSPSYKSPPTKSEIS